MKTVFVFLTILASALCATLPCGWSFHIKPHKVQAKAHASACSSFKVEHHFTFGCKGGKTPTPVAGPVISDPIVSNPRPVLPAPVQLSQTQLFPTHAQFFQP